MNLIVGIKMSVSFGIGRKGADDGWHHEDPVEG